MLCPSCHVHTHKGFPFCLKCGLPLKGASIESATPSVLYRPDSDAGLALIKPCTTVGRAADNDVVIADQYVSRYHARVWREPQGYRLEDLDSMNGVFVNGGQLPAGGAVRLKDFDVIALGPNSMVRIEQPRSVEVGGKTMISAPEESLVIGAGTLSGAGVAPATMLAQPGSGLEMKPRRRSGWALKQAPSKPGALRYVLRNTRGGQYLQLTDRDVFLWNLMDGEHSIRDLLLAYSSEYGQLALARIQQLIDQLAGASLIRGVGGADEKAERSGARRIYEGVIRALTKAELAISGVDGLMEGIYRAVGWVFFTVPGLVVIWGLAFGGLAAFVVALRHQRPLEVGGAGILGLLVAILGYSLALMLHEMAHALAVKSYGRRVPRGGFMLMMGMPYAFVDTTDMWFEGRRARIVVTLAGPIVTLSVAAFFSLAAVLLPGSVWPAIAFQIAFGLYINTLFNFNPLIPLDGYYALSDWLEMPRLREEASAYFTRGLWRDLKNRNHIGKKQVGLFLYGMISVVGLIGFLALGALMWNSRLGSFTRQHVPHPFDTVILVVLLLLLFFPIWYAPVMKIKFAISRRMHPETRQVELDTANTAQPA